MRPSHGSTNSQQTPSAESVPRVEVSELTKGARVLLEDGTVGEVVSIAADQKTASLRVVESPFDPGKEGSLMDATSFDLVAFVEGDGYDSSKSSTGPGRTNISI